MTSGAGGGGGQGGRIDRGGGGKRGGGEVLVAGAVRQRRRGFMDGRRGRGWRGRVRQMRVTGGVGGGMHGRRQRRERRGDVLRTREDTVRVDALRPAKGLKRGGATHIGIGLLDLAEDGINGAVVNPEKAELLQEGDALHLGHLHRRGRRCARGRGDGGGVEAGERRRERRGHGGDGGVDLGDEVSEVDAVALVHVVVEVAAVGGDGAVAARAVAPAGVLLAVRLGAHAPARVLRGARRAARRRGWRCGMHVGVVAASGLWRTGAAGIGEGVRVYMDAGGWGWVLWRGCGMGEGYGACREIWWNDGKGGRGGQAGNKRFSDVGHITILVFLRLGCGQSVTRYVSHPCFYSKNYIKMARLRGWYETRTVALYCSYRKKKRRVTSRRAPWSAS